jgi:hypothetical protein
MAPHCGTLDTTRARARRARSAAMRRRSWRLAQRWRGRARARSERVRIRSPPAISLSLRAAAARPLLVILPRPRPLRSAPRRAHPRPYFSPSPAPVDSKHERGQSARAIRARGLFPRSQFCSHLWERTNPTISTPYAACSRVPIIAALLMRRARARSCVCVRAYGISHLRWEHGNKSLKPLRRKEKAVPEHGNKLGNMGTSNAPASPLARSVLASEHGATAPE